MIARADIVEECARKSVRQCVVWRWAEQCPIVPSPHVGEGQEGGYRQSAERDARSLRRPYDDGSVYLLDLRYKANAMRVIPPSLSLPHKWGGNRVARTFATHTFCLRVDLKR